ncbi:MAG: hypothetical protein CMO55_09495 [Verrucomicrobiales bacterium]|nr:hypothetical protein [Verrucomicrobiales bacterium]
MREGKEARGKWPIITGAALALFAMAFLILAGWHVVRPMDSVFIDDYGALSLSHGLAGDINFGGARGNVVTQLRYTHPGIPYQFVSWLAFRAATIKGSDAFERAAIVFDDPNRFFVISCLFATVISIAGMVAWWCVGRKFGADSLVLLGSLLLPLCSTESWRYYVSLGNETFALPLFAGYAWLLAILSRKSGLGEAPSPFRSYWVAVLCFGIIGGLAFLVKLNYLVWMIAIPMGMVLIAIRRRESRAPLFRFTGMLALATPVGLATAYLGCLIFIGHEGIREMFARHLGIAVHSGRYGSGEATVLSAGEMIQNAERLLFENPGIILIPLSILLIGILVRRKKRVKRWNDLEAFLIATATVTFLLALAATLKHFAPRYLLCGTLAIGLTMVIEVPRWPKLVRSLFVFGVVAFAAIGLEYYRGEIQKNRAFLAEVEKVESELAALEEGFSVCYYHPRHPDGEVAWAMDMCASRDAALAWIESDLAQNMRFYGDSLKSRTRWGTDRVRLDEVPWRYIWMRANYDEFWSNTRKGTDPNTAGNLGPSSTYFDGRIAKVHQAETFLVLERSEEDFSIALEEWNRRSPKPKKSKKRKSRIGSRKE